MCISRWNGSGINLASRAALTNALLASGGSPSGMIEAAATGGFVVIKVAPRKPRNPAEAGWML